MEKVGLGGGCHWCTEGVFQALKGVLQVDQGFIQSEAPSDAWAEGVVVTFDPAIIRLATLIEVHLKTHSANRTSPPGGRYRSAIYVFEAKQHLESARIVARFAEVWGETLRTSVLPFLGFKPSEARYQNYYRTDPGRPFCRRYIDPKLEYIQRHFAHVALSDAADHEP